LFISLSKILERNQEREKDNKKRSREKIKREINSFLEKRWRK
jgi:hypothetical protein